MTYRTQRLDSPSSIARKFGVPMGALIGANPQKPTTVVAGVRTWQSLGVGEDLNVPVGVGSLGAIAPSSPSAPHSMIRQGSSGPDVALWQTIIGTTPDGQFGPNTAAATRSWQSSHGLSADGVVGPLTWAAALGGAFPSAAPSTAPSVANIPTAVQALSSIDPCDPSNVSYVCQLQSALGVGVDGKYGPGTAAAARRVLSSAPAACSPRPSWWVPAGQSNCGGAAAPVPVAPPPMPSPVPVQPAPSGSPAAPGSAPLPATGTLTPPTDKKLSTGAIVAGALGATALVGLLAVAATMGKGKSGARGARGKSRKSGPHKAHKKPAHKAKKRK